MAGGRSPVRADGAPLLVWVGHTDCDTSTLVLRFVDRMHARGGRALAVLQDGEAEARTLVEELGLGLPVRRDGEPYALGQALGLVGVPVLYLLDADSRVQRLAEGFVRREVEDMAAALGLASPFFGPQEAVPEWRPG